MIHCGNECPDHSQECAEFLELAGRLQATISVLQERLNNLSLKDLTDVNNCLAPLVNDHLVFKGVTWDAQAPDQLEIEVESVPYPIPIATITQQGCPTTLYCKDGTNVRIVPKDLGDDTLTIADVYLDGQKVELKQKNYDNIELGDKVEIVRDIVSGTKIATFKITRDGTTQNTALYVPAVTVTNTLNSGTKVATIKVGSTQKDIYVPKATDVQVTPLTDEGKHIATITVDGVPKEIYSGADDGGTLDNIKVNEVLGTVNDKIAEVTVYGSDIETSETTFPESEEVNEDLEIQAGDKIDVALGKLQKALKDDEAAVTQAFNSVMEAAGFDEMLHYQKEPEGTILGDDENVHSLKTADAKLQTKIKENIDRLTLHEDNSLIFVPYGTPAAGTSTNTFSVGDKNINDLPYVHVIQLPQQVIFNLTADYPLPANEYWAMGSGSHNVISLEMANYLYTDVLIRSGCILTFQTSATTWESYQYIGPNEGNRISVNGWTTPGNWYKLWTATQA